MKTRRRSSPKLKKLHSDINVVPYIDVMLVLLVIFMITAPLLNQGMRVKLPQTQGSLITPKATSIIVSIDSQGHTFANINKNPTQSISLDRLLQLVSKDVKANKAQPNAFVKADKSVAYGTVAQAISVLKKAGLNQVSLFTKPTHNH